ncbi:MAG: hypothetical protein KDB61_04220 [Planctomycetes bacterium]|nr:hypothetical protein [Planctomycetota bacterium]
MIVSTLPACIALSFLGTVLAPANPAPQELEAPKVTFSAPGLGKVWAAVGPTTVPDALPVEAQELSETPFGKPVLVAWSRAMAQVGEPETALEDRVRARLTLCLIAKAQGRDQDAWHHFERLGDGPGAVARALPHLWPGVPFQVNPGPGGRLQLPANVALQPAFHLLPEDEGRAGTGPQSMTWTGGLRVGSEALDLRSTLQPEGLEMDLWNRGAAACNLRVTLPTPRNFEAAYTYSDWEQTEDAQAGISIQLPAQREEPWTLFCRLKPAFEAWPGLPKNRSDWFQDRELRLVLDKDEVPSEDMQALAQALSDRLQIPVGFADSQDPPELRSVTIDMGSGVENSPSEPQRKAPSPRQARVRRLLSSVEEFLLP